MIGFQKPAYMITHFGLSRQFANLKEELLEASSNALISGIWVDGPYASQLTEWLKQRTTAKYAILVHSGTQALHIIAKYKLTESRYAKPIINLSTNYKPTILIPNLTYPATLNAFLSAGWDVILGDTDNKGLLNDRLYDSELYSCIVGLYGKSPKFVERLTTHTSSKTIIDGAQHWLECNGEIASGMAISFDPTKNLPASGNGGAIVTNDILLYEFSMQYRNNGKNNTKYSMVGTNSKLSEQDCAQLMVRTKYIDQWQNRRKKIAQYYIDNLKNLPIRVLNDTKNHAQQKFVIYTNDRATLRHKLMSEGIETKVHYEYVLGDLDIAANIPKPNFLSISKMLSMGVLSLPIYPELLDSEIEYIIDSIKKVVLVN